MVASKYLSQEVLMDGFELKVDFRNGHETLWRRTKRGLVLVKNTVSNKGGYCQLKYKQHRIMYHQIVAILTLGDVPEGYTIDHIDRDKTNNQSWNLRFSTHRKQTWNKDIMEGFLLGVTEDKRNGGITRFTASIEINGRSCFLGSHETREKANGVYLIASKMVEDGFSKNFIQRCFRIRTKSSYSSKYKGVYFIRKLNRWECQVYVSGKRIRLGFYMTEKEAYKVLRDYREKNNLGAVEEWGRV